jgi:hypothetical protein
LDKTLEELVEHKLEEAKGYSLNQMRILISTSISSMESSELKEFDNANFVENITKQIIQSFQDKASILFPDILIIADREKVNELEQEISKKIKQFVNKEHAKRCISVIIPEELKKAEEKADLDIQQELANFNIDDVYMYSFIALSTETQNKFVSIMKENLKALNSQIITSSQFEEATTNLRKYISNKMDLEEKIIKEKKKNKDDEEKRKKRRRNKKLRRRKWTPRNKMHHHRRPCAKSRHGLHR